jgi:surface protein
MYEAFQKAVSFNQDISAWDTSNVKSMKRMFKGASSFDQDLSDWDISSLTDASLMFKGSALSNANYDAILIGWGAQDVNDGVSFHAGDARYSSGAAAEARARLVDEHGWIIEDGGQL